MLAPAGCVEAAPTTCTAVGVNCSSESTTSATTQVMLSGPPLRKARATRCSQHSSGVSVSSKTSWIVSALTTPESPSEQSNQRSPTTAARTDSSKVTSPSMSPNTRNSTERLG